MFSWVSQPKNIFHFSTDNVEYQLNNEYKKIGNINGLKTNLYPHQQTAIQAMVDLEQVRIFNGFDDTIHNYNITTSAGVLSEPVGSGKTIDILGLIIIQPMPNMIPDIMDIPIFSSNNKNKFICSSIIRRTFKHILKPTLVFVGSSVLKQWESSVKKFTYLKYMLISNVYDLQRLLYMMIDKTINKYDIVIVKNGQVTGNIKFPDGITIEHKNLYRTKVYIYNVLVNMRNIMWARVVIDDFDVIKLPHNAGIINAVFTWYVSSTKQNTKTVNFDNKHYKTTSELLMFSDYNCHNIMKNKVLFYNFNIQNDSEYIKIGNNISSPNFYIYRFKNINNVYMELMGLMCDNDINNLMEMLNSDAIETAAEQIGIKTTRVSDIFQTVLGQQYEKYNKSSSILKFIDEVELNKKNRKHMSENPDVSDTYNKTDLINCRPINYNYPNLKGLLNDVKIEYSEIKQKTSTAIDRVKKNITDGECPICVCSLTDDDENIIILKCCGNVVCGSCCFGTLFTKESNIGQCSNCRTRLHITELIYLNKDFDITKIVDEKIEYETKTPEKTETRTKLDAIMEIINGIVPNEQTKINIHISNMMLGDANLPNINSKKILIFTNYNETILEFIKLLNKHNIKFWKLIGGPNDMTKIVNEFNLYENICVMIINSMSHCPGLNLQSATDLIFMHKILNKNIETQVIGRGQRLGRVSKLNVHYLLYENEYNWMKTYDNIHEYI